MTDAIADIVAALRDEQRRWGGGTTGEYHRRAADEIERLRAENARLREALEAMRYPCTCHEAYVGRGKEDPNCLAAEVGDDARQALGEPGVCRGRAAFEAKLRAASKGE